jgi:hypothetical protein
VNTSQKEIALLKKVLGAYDEDSNVELTVVFTVRGPGGEIIQRVSRVLDASVSLDSGENECGLVETVLVEELRSHSATFSDIDVLAELCCEEDF